MVLSYEFSLSCRGRAEVEAMGGGKLMVPTSSPVCVCVCVTCSVLSDRTPMDCNSPGSPVHWLLQVSIQVWVTFPFPRGFFQPRDGTQVSRIAVDSLPSEPPGKPLVPLPHLSYSAFTTWLSFLTQISIAYASWLFVHILSNCWVIQIENLWNLIFVWQLTNYFFLNFIYLWLHWVFTAAAGYLYPRPVGVTL